MQTPADKTLVTELIKGSKGSKKAFLMLYEKYHAPLYRHALKFVKSSALAEDVVQDTFLKVWENRQTLRADLSFVGYINTVSRNQVLNTLKRASHETVLKKGILYAADRSRNSTEDAFLDAEYEKMVNKAIEQLPSQRRLVFRMCRLEGKTYDEVAQKLGISKNTVKEHMVSALKSLREYFSVHADVTFLLMAGMWIFRDTILP